MTVNFNACWKSLISASCIITSLTAAHVASASTLIQGEVTADNSFALYTGSKNNANTVWWAGGSEWGQPVSFNFKTSDSTLYIAAWSDDGSAQGLLQDLKAKGNRLLDKNWEVFATGIDLDSVNSPSPTLAELTAQINIANADAGNPNTTSGGWVPVTIGGSNGIQPWGDLSSIDDDASWMWYDSGKQGGTLAPFRGGFDHDEYLIFRASVPEPSAVIALLAVSALGLGKLRRRHSGF